MSYSLSCLALYRCIGMEFSLFSLGGIVDIDGSYVVEIKDAAAI